MKKLLVVLAVLFGTASCSQEVTYPLIVIKANGKEKVRFYSKEKCLKKQERINNRIIRSKHNPYYGVKY